MDTNMTSPNRVSSKFFSIALTAGVGLWLTAMAPDMAVADPVRKQSAPVTYGDLDLSTEQGAKTLLTRISKAAKTACGELTHSALLPRESAYQWQCVTGAVDAAVARIDAPLVAALHKSQPGIALAAR